MLPARHFQVPLSDCLSGFLSCIVTIPDIPIPFFVNIVIPACVRSGHVDFLFVLYVLITSMYVVAEEMSSVRYPLPKTRRIDDNGYDFELFTPFWLERIPGVGDDSDRVHCPEP